MFVRKASLIAVIVLLLVGVGSVSAHATLVRSDPPANAVLDKPPQAIRLWFTEPVEPDFSRITLRDASGTTLETLPSQVDSSDATQMSLRVGNLTDGVYTVTWRNVSAADGHEAEGSFPITIGKAVATSGAVALNFDESVPLGATLIRWFNLLSLSLLVGGISFRMFVWSPALPGGNPLAERRMRWVVWIGWLLVGVSGVLLLVLQAAVAIGNPSLSVITDPAFKDIITHTRFGSLWVARMEFWAGTGALLAYARNNVRMYWMPLLVAGNILVTTSLFSHASSTPDSAVSIAADFLHLLATTLWIGGLAQFVVVIGVVRRELTPSAPVLGALVGYFSNFARVAVASLIVTGLYAAWLQVGSIDGLLTTLYGQTLVVKGLLIVPLLGIAAINLVYTHRALQSGKETGGMILHGLVSMEIVLTVGILGTVGVLTSSYPARLTTAVRAATPAPTPAKNLFTMHDVDGMHIHLGIYPGWVGNNTFDLNLFEDAMTGKPITDASLIRLRFDNLDQKMGTSELRPVSLGDGTYEIQGANLSVAGNWRIRITIQRPGKYDTVNDFEFNMELPPLPPAAPPVQAQPSLSEREVALLAVGLAALALGGFFAGEMGWRAKWRVRSITATGATALVIGLLLGGVAFLVSGVQAMQTVAEAAPAPVPINTSPPAEKLVKFHIQYQAALPHLLTDKGTLLEPDDQGIWHPMTVDAKVTDVYVDPKGIVWASTDAGLRVYQNGAWEQLDAVPETRIKLVHGYMLAFGGTQTTRIPTDVDTKFLLHLAPPDTSKPANDLYMLGDHSHAILSDQKVFLTFDEGKTWEPLDTPAPIVSIGTDIDGNLLAGTADNLLLWNYDTHTWEKTLPLPGGQPITAMDNSSDTLYAVAGGKLYRQQGTGWQLITLLDIPGANMSWVQYQYPDTWWVLDSANARLWSTNTSGVWKYTQVVVNTN